MAEPLIGGFEPYGTLQQFDLATPEKALFDVLYLSAQKGRRFAHLPELTLPDGFTASAVDGWIARIGNVLLRGAVRERWADLARRVG
jgi:hypothetical protein